MYWSWTLYFLVYCSSVLHRIVCLRMLCSNNRSEADRFISLVERTLNIEQRRGAEREIQCTSKWVSSFNVLYLLSLFKYVRLHLLNCTVQVIAGRYSTLLYFLLCSERSLCASRHIARDTRPATFMSAPRRGAPRATSIIASYLFIFLNYQLCSILQQYSFVYTNNCTPLIQ